MLSKLQVGFDTRIHPPIDKGSGRVKVKTLGLILHTPEGCRGGPSVWGSAPEKGDWMREPARDGWRQSGIEHLAI